MTLENDTYAILKRGIVGFAKDSDGNYEIGWVLGTEFATGWSRRRDREPSQLTERRRFVVPAHSTVVRNV